MKCPIDSVDLLMSDRQGIEIDYCPTCRGVWLDRGELDKIIEYNRESIESARERPRDTREGPRDTREGPAYNREGSGDRGSSPKPKKRKREGFLGELFEFGG